jgi:methionine transaminase
VPPQYFALANTEGFLFAILIFSIMTIHSKLPNVGTTIFTIMSALAQEHGAINLSQGFPNFDSPEKLKRLVTKYLKLAMNQYAPMAGIMPLREQLAYKIEKMYGCTVNPQTEITITAGGTQGLFTAITAFIKQEDEVILIEPAYDSYAPSVEVCGGTVVPYRLVPPTKEASEYSIDWVDFRKLISPKTRMIIINTPHNPTGKTLKDSDLQELEQITEGGEILILSDEVYEHLIFDKQEHQSVLRYPNLFKRSIASFSFGKTFHATGWKMGYVIGPDYLMQEFRKVHQFNVFSVNTPVQYAIADFLKDENTYLSLPKFYQKKRDYFLKLMAGSRFMPIKTEGTYFQLFDYQAISDEKDVDFVRRMTLEFGVAAIPVSVFYSQNGENSKNTEGGAERQFIRLCFAKTEDLLEKAAEKLYKI